MTFGRTTTGPSVGAVGQQGSARVDVFLAMVLVAVATLPWIGGLGFYSDDWVFLSQYDQASSQTWGGFFDATHTANTGGRPVQVAWQSGLYALFGTNLLALHIVNTAVLALAAAALMLLLRQVAPRPVAVAIAAVFATMAHYSTVRFWFASNQAALAGLFCFISGYCLARSLKTDRRPVLSFLASIVALVVTTLSYEIFLTSTVVFGLAGLWYAGRNRRGAAWMPIAYLAALGATLVVKQVISERTATTDGVVARTVWLARNQVLALIVDFVDLGLLLPVLVLRRLIAGDIPLVGVIIAIALSAIGGWWLRAALVDSDAPSRRLGVQLIIGGTLFAIAARSIYLVTAKSWQVTALGLANRVDYAPALGIAGAFIGFAIVASRSERVLPAIVAAIVLFQLLTVSLIGEQWKDASVRQEALLANLRSDLPQLTDESTVILDTCTAVGGAPTFDAYWAVKGALQRTTGLSNINGDVLSEEVTVTDADLKILVYGDEIVYPWDDDLILYAWPAREVTILSDAAAFSESSAGCPTTRAGLGSPVLNGPMDWLFEYRYGS